MMRVTVIAMDQLILQKLDCQSIIIHKIIVFKVSKILWTETLGPSPLILSWTLP